MWIGDDRMGKHYFTDEQVELLNLNPYVKKASNKAITYTEEFRKEFFMAYQCGKTPAVILRDMGFDIQVLGQKRVSNIAVRVKEQALRADGFKDTRTNNSARTKTKDMSPEEKIEYLEHQLKFKDQQIEALKKMKQADRKAQWKYLRNQKKNTK